MSKFQSKFNIFTIDLRVILWIIVATGVYALLLKFLQKNSPHNVQTNGGGRGSKAQKLHFSYRMASLTYLDGLYTKSRNDKNPTIVVNIITWK